MGEQLTKAELTYLIQHFEQKHGALGRDVVPCLACHRTLGGSYAAIQSHNKDCMVVKLKRMLKKASK